MGEQDDDLRSAVEGGNGILTIRGSGTHRGWNGILCVVPIVGDVLVRLGLRAAWVVRGIGWAVMVTAMLSDGRRD